MYDRQTKGIQRTSDSSNPGPGENFKAYMHSVGSTQTLLSMIKPINNMTIKSTADFASRNQAIAASPIVPPTRQINVNRAH